MELKHVPSKPPVVIARLLPRQMPSFVVNGEGTRKKGCIRKKPVDMLPKLKPAQSQDPKTGPVESHLPYQAASYNH